MALLSYRNIEAVRLSWLLIVMGNPNIDSDLVTERQSARGQAPGRERQVSEARSEPPIGELRPVGIQQAPNKGDLA